MSDYFRNANIALAVGGPMLVVGAVIIGPDNEGALLLLLVAVFSTMAIIKVKLDNRTLKRHQESRDQ